MTARTDGHRGILVFAGVAMTGVTAVSGLLHAMHVPPGDRRASALILVAMWMPAFARYAATRTVDRVWRSPLPLTRWGSPWLTIVLVPLAMVCAVYLGAYGIAWVAGVTTAAPVWRGSRAVLNIAVNLPLLAVIGLFGSLGEEIGWRGYLQPRLDQLDVPASLLWVVVLETLFHVPLILLAGYLADEGQALLIALFFSLKLGATPVWTWATYRWRTIWMAAWFHTFHNAVSQVLVPKTLGAGSPLVLGESGVLPAALYLVAAAVVLGRATSRGTGWRDVATHALR